SLHYPSYLLTFPFFFFNAPATTELYTLSLHDALPISTRRLRLIRRRQPTRSKWRRTICTTKRPASSCRAASPRFRTCNGGCASRSEEHTSELQSRFDLVCRLLLEKKKKNKNNNTNAYK